MGYIYVVPFIRWPHLLLPLMSKTYSISWQSNVAASCKQWIFKLQISEVYLKIDLYTIFRNGSWLFWFFRRIQFIFRSKISYVTTVASVILFFSGTVYQSIGSITARGKIISTKLVLIFAKNGLGLIFIIISFFRGKKKKS